MNDRIITQIGSLPFKDVNLAIEYSLRHDIPFLPELPLLGDGILDYIKEPGKLSCLAEFAKHQFSVAKIQCVGPATLIVNGLEEKEALKRISQHISAIYNCLQTEKTILFLDEPELGTAGFDYKARGLTESRYREMGFVPVEYEKLWQFIFGELDREIGLGNTILGIHTCSNVDWNQLFASKTIEIVSFDSSKYGQRLLQAGGYRSDKKIAWGIETARDVGDFHAGDLITLPCGMTQLKYTVEDCKSELNKLKQIAKGLLKKQ